MTRVWSWIAPVGTAVLAVVLWALALHFEVLDRALLPTPSEVGRRLAELLASKDFYRHAQGTVTLAGYGLLIGAALGLPLGAVMGMSRKLDSALRMYVEFLRALPAVALIPLFMVVFSPAVGRILVVAVPVGLVITVSARSGIRGDNRRRRELGQLYGLSNVALFQKVLIWGALPSILAGTRVALSLALVLATVVEMLLGARYGLGDLIMNAATVDRAAMFVGIGVLGFIGYTLNLIALSVEERVLSRFLGRT